MKDTSPDIKTTASPWVNSDGIVAHPDAPLGGGGPGHFSSAAENDSNPIPHPMSPAGRNLNLTRNDIMKLQEAGVALADAQSVKVTTKVTLNISEEAGKPIKFDAANYAQLYQQVQARANTGAEAGSVTRSFDERFYDVDEFGNVGRVVYTIVLTTSLPLWTNLAKQPQKDQDKFNKWRASVVIHEQRHVDIYNTEFAKLKTDVTGPKEAEVTAQSKKIDDHADDEQEKFDLDKSTQPAGLPVPGGMTKVP